MKLRLSQAAEFLGLSPGPGGVVTGWSVDSRTLRPGDLFFALRGPNHNGHAYIEEVFRKGAVAVVVDQEIHGGAAPEGRVLRVADAFQGLRQLAARARQSWGGRVVAVTGSAGKTTTKDIIADMLAGSYRTAKNEGNLNNEVGLPLSLLRIEDAAEIAVLEMGMNHAGEIRRLAEIARPETGVVTNVGWAHIESFDSIEGIAAAKRELIEELPGSGTAVLNADDPRVREFAKHTRARAVTYGQAADAEVRAQDIEYAAEGTKFRVGAARFETPLAGRHSVSNFLAGIATAGVFGIAPEKLTEKVFRFTPAKMRGERFHHEGVLVYNDCYNSNPDAVRAMLDVLRDTPARKRIAVLGEMLELGREAETLHRGIGRFAVEQGIDAVIGIRGAARFMVEEAMNAGMSDSAAIFFDTPEQAGEFVHEYAQPGDAVLFKGSRGVQVEKALDGAFNGSAAAQVRK